LNITPAEGLSLQCLGQWTFLRIWQQVRHLQEQLTATLQKCVQETRIADIGNAMGGFQEARLADVTLWNIATGWSSAETQD
jgi:hypothetical protein